MRLLITGATGFLGGHLARALLDGEFDLSVQHLRVTGRRKAAGAPLARAGAEFLTGDLADPAFARRVVAGADAVVHCAGVTGLGGPRRYYAANVTTTRVLLEAARRADVERFVNIGTPSVLFRPRDQERVPEDDLPPRPPDPYSASKLAAERLALAAHGPEFLALSLRPRFVSGHGETNILGRFVELHRRGRLRRVGPGSNLVDFTDVRNAAAAIVAALRVPASAGGRAYNVTNDAPVPLWPFLDELMAQLGLPPVSRRAPYPVVRGVGVLVDAWARLRGQPAPLSPIGAAIMRYTFTLDVTAARRVLGYTPRYGNGEMLAAFVAWWRERA